MAIILGITTCPGNSCPSINPSSPGGVGDVLFSGSWDPQANGPPQLGFHQNFTVEVPQLPSGEALLTLTHLELVGVSESAASAVMPLAFWKWRADCPICSLGVTRCLSRVALR